MDNISVDDEESEIVETRSVSISLIFVLFISHRIVSEREWIPLSSVIAEIEESSRVFTVDP